MISQTICSAGPTGRGNGRGEQERLSLYVTVRVGEMERAVSEIPPGVGPGIYPAGNPNQEEIDRVDPAR